MCGCYMLIFWYRTEHMFKGYVARKEFNTKYGWMQTEWICVGFFCCWLRGRFQGYIQIKCHSVWTLSDFMVLIERLHNMQINKLYYGPFKVVTNRWVCDNQIWCAFIFHARENTARKAPIATWYSNHFSGIRNGFCWVFLWSELLQTGFLVFQALN